MNFLKRNRRKK